MPPDGHRSEGTLSLSEVPYVREQPFWLLLGRLPKVTRRKGGTLSRHHRSNGYAPNPKTPNNKIKRSHPSATPTLVPTACPSSPRPPPPKESVPCPIENAIVQDANAQSRKATIPTPCTASTTAAKPAPITTRAVKSAQAKAAIARIPNNGMQKKWSLIRLHFQFQTLIIQPLGMPHSTLQPPAFNPHHHGFRLVEVFR